MVQSGNVIIGSGAVALNRGGKIKNIYVGLLGDRTWNLRETNVSGKILYKVDANVPIAHTNINVVFKDALYVEDVTGATGEINIMYD